MDWAIRVKGIFEDMISPGLDKVGAKAGLTKTQFDKLSISLKKVNGDMATMRGQAHKATTQTGNLNKSLGTTVLKGLAIGAAIGIAYKAFQKLSETISQALKGFREFQVRMAEVSTIIDISGTKLGSFEQTMFNLAQGVRVMSMQYGKSAEDLSRGLYDILSAAVPAEHALNLLNIATKAAVAGLTDVSTSVDVMTSVMNAYGYSVSQMAEVSDIMFKAVVRGKFRYEDLASALGYITPIAAQAGVSFAELAAAISSATRQGQHVDMVSRGLALSIQNIIKPGKAAADAAEELGIDLSLAALQGQGLEGFLKNLAVATKGNAAAISEIIPNMRSYRVAMVLASREAVEYRNDVKLMNSAIGETAIAFGKIASTMDMHLNILEQHKNEMSRIMGEEMQILAIYGQKWDIFVQGFVKSTFNQNRPEKMFGPLGGIIGSVGRGIKGTMDITKEAEKTVADYLAEQSDRIMNPEKYSEKESLFTTLQEGGEFDVSSYQSLNAELEDVEKRLVGIGQAYIDAVKLGATGDALKPLLDLYQEAEAEHIILTENMNYYSAAIGTAAAGFRDGDIATYIEDQADAIEVLAQRLSKLGDEIGIVGEKYDGELGRKLKEMEVKKPLDEMTHWTSVAFKDVKYQTELGTQGYEWYTAEMAEAIKVVREYEAAQKEATQAQNEFNFALAQNRLETMKIQLLGMMRRRGNTRAETRLLKNLSIERTELQIAEAERELAKEKELLIEGVDNAEAAYQASKDFIDAQILDQQHLLWKTQDTKKRDHPY